MGNVPDQGRKSLTLDDLSLFVTGHFGRFFNPFTEAELTHFDFVQSESESTDRGDGDFVFERLYNDSYLTDSLTLRLGKLLTPVGEWNQIYAAPLALTTVRPAVTFRNFSEYTTGASLLFSDPDAQSPHMQVYWQPAGELSEWPNGLTVHQYRGGEGAHISFPIGLLDKVGASLQRSKDVRGPDQTLYGIDFHYTVGRLTFQGEGTYSDIGNTAGIHIRKTEWGAYIATSYALTDQWQVYGWYEGFADRAASSTAHDLLFGISYWPLPETVIKAEFLYNVGGQPVNPTGVFTSWSVLF